MLADFWYFVGTAVAVLVVIVLIRSARVVPQQAAYVVENLGRYSRTIQAGFHWLIPFFERVAYKHSLKEQAIDIPEQICITKDNVQVGVDGVLYLQVLDAQRNLFAGELGLAQLRLAERLSVVQLYRALGGGWQ